MTCGIDLAALGIVGLASAAAWKLSAGSVAAGLYHTREEALRRDRSRGDLTFAEGEGHSVHVRLLVGDGDGAEGVSVRLSTTTADGHTAASLAP